MIRVEHLMVVEPIGADSVVKSILMGCRVGGDDTIYSVNHINSQIVKELGILNSWQGEGMKRLFWKMMLRIATIMAKIAFGIVTKVMNGCMCKKEVM